MTENKKDSIDLPEFITKPERFRIIYEKDLNRFLLEQIRDTKKAYIKGILVGGIVVTIAIYLCNMVYFLLLLRHAI